MRTHPTEIRLTGQALRDAVAEAEAYLATPEAAEAEARWEAAQKVRRAN